jgi:hypothetical protein
MKKFLLVPILFVFALLLGSCSWLRLDSSGDHNVPYNMTTADKSHYNTIGLEFKKYFEEDEAISIEIKNDYNSTLEYWVQNGSDRAVFKKIIGQNMDGPYISYVDSDEKLTEADREARYINISSC